MAATLDHPAAEPRVPAPPGLRPARLVGGAVAGGGVVELLLHNTLVNGAPPGLGFSIAGALAAVAVLGGRALVGRPPSRAAASLAALAAVFAAFVAVRAAPELAVANIGATGALLLGAAYLYAEGRLVDVTLTEYPAAALRTLGGTLAGPAEFAAATRQVRPRWEGIAAAVRPVLRGLAVAAVPLLVFAALFASADAVFADWIGRPFSLRLSLRGGFWGVVLAAFFAWSALGLGWYATTHRDRPDQPSGIRHRALGPVEAAVAVGALVALFAAFVAVQLAYLFGGAARVADTGGLTYAEYARRGFFELLVVAALVTAVALAVDWWALPAGSERPRVVVGLLYALVALTGVVLASAVVRLDAYVDEFGLSKLRLYAFAVLVWVAFLLAWLAFTVLRGDRRPFPAGAFLAGVAVLLALNVANPDAAIAGVNIDRAAAGSRPLDTTYAAFSLSDDAVPMLVARLDELDECRRELLALQLELAAVQRDGGWRSFNLGRARADRLLGDPREPGAMPAC